MILQRLSILTLPQRIGAGVAALVLIVAGLLWYRHALIADGHEAGKTAAEKVCTDTRNAEIAKALKAHTDAQAALDADTAAQEAAANTAAVIAAVDAKVGALRTTIRGIRQATPLAPTCRAGRDRMQVVADARAGQ